MYACMDIMFQEHFSNTANSRVAWMKRFWVLTTDFLILIFFVKKGRPSIDIKEADKGSAVVVWDVGKITSNKRLNNLEKLSPMKRL